MVDKFIRDIIDRKRHVVRHLLGSSSKTNINSFQLSFIFKITTSLFPKLHIFRQTFSSFLELKKAFYIVWFPTLYKVASTTGLPQESNRIQTVKLKIPGKSRIPNFCYIQVIVFDLGYLPVAAVGT